LKAARGGRRETTAKVLKDRRSHRRRGRMGTSVIRTTTRLHRGRLLPQDEKRGLALASDVVHAPAQGDRLVHPRGRHVARVRPHLAGDLLRLNQRGVAVAIREGIGTALRGGLALRHLRGFLRLERSLLRFLRGLGRGEEEEEEEEEDGDGRRRGGVDRQSANGAASAVSGEGRDATGPRARSAPSSPPADRIDRTTEATRRRGGPSSQPSSRRRLRRRRRSPPAAPREGRRRTSSVMSGSRGGTVVRSAPRGVRAQPIDPVDVQYLGSRASALDRHVARRRTTSGARLSARITCVLLLPRRR